MASIKDLKKEFVYTYGALLDQCYLVQMIFPNTDPQAAEALGNEIEEAYLAMLGKLSRREGTAAACAKAARQAFDASVEALSAKLEALAEDKPEAPKARKKAAPKAEKAAEGQE